jgi:Cof subfamily protein (haloacid dehalogenase superfamily)
VIRPRTLAALERARAAGLRTIVVTGRMVQSLRRVVEPVGVEGPSVCYQGAVVVDRDWSWLRHEPVPLELAREALDAVLEEGYTPNLYADDELYVAEVNDWVRAYADFQQLLPHPVGDLRAWLDRPPTKLVCVGESDELDGLELRLRERFGERLYVTKSLPYFLELAAPGVTKAAGLEFLGERLGFSAEQVVAFGDGENDVELMDWAGYAVAVGNAHERVKAAADWVGPEAAEEGVALVLEALLDSRA